MLRLNSIALMSLCRTWTSKSGRTCLGLDPNFADLTSMPGLTPVYYCVTIGAGLRAPARLVLFERLLNATWSTSRLQEQRYAATQGLRIQLKPYNGGFDTA
jgi:hypothetical protein